MDVSVLRSRIQSTLDSNADVRRQSELDLKYVRLTSIWLSFSSLLIALLKAEEQPGFINALLDILQAEQDNGVRLSSSSSSHSWFQYSH